MAEKALEEGSTGAIEVVTAKVAGFLPGTTSNGRPRLTSVCDRLQHAYGLLKILGTVGINQSKELQLVSNGCIVRARSAGDGCPGTDNARSGLQKKGWISPRQS